VASSRLHHVDDRGGKKKMGNDTIVALKGSLRGGDWGGGEIRMARFPPSFKILRPDSKRGGIVVIGETSSDESREGIVSHVGIWY